MVIDHGQRTTDCTVGLYVQKSRTTDGALYPSWSPLTKGEESESFLSLCRLHTKKNPAEGIALGGVHTFLEPRCGDQPQPILSVTPQLEIDLQLTIHPGGVPSTCCIHALRTTVHNLVHAMAGPEIGAAGLPGHLVVLEEHGVDDIQFLVE